MRMAYEKYVLLLGMFMQFCFDGKCADSLIIFNVELLFLNMSSR